MPRIIAAVCLLSLAACANGDVRDTTTVPVSNPAVAAPAETTAPPHADTTSLPRPAGTTSAGGAATSCVVGEWELDTEEFEAHMEAYYDASGMSSAVAITAGRVLLDFDSRGVFVGGYDELMVDIAMGEVPGLTIAFGGVVSGGYSITGDTLVLLPDDQSTFTASVEVGGVAVAPMDELGSDDVDLFSQSTSIVTCDLSRMTIRPEIGLTSVWIRR